MLEDANNIIMSIMMYYNEHEKFAKQSNIL